MSNILCVRLRIGGWEERFLFFRNALDDNVHASFGGLCYSVYTTTDQTLRKWLNGCLKTGITLTRSLASLISSHRRQGYFEFF